MFTFLASYFTLGLIANGFYVYHGFKLEQCPWYARIVFWPVLSAVMRTHWEERSKKLVHKFDKSLENKQTELENIILHSFVTTPEKWKKERYGDRRYKLINPDIDISMEIYSNKIDILLSTERYRATEISGSSNLRKKSSKFVEGLIEIDNFNEKRKNELKLYDAVNKKVDFMWQKLGDKAKAIDTTVESEEQILGIGKKAVSHAMPSPTVSHSDSLYSKLTSKSWKDFNRIKREEEAQRMNLKLNLD